MEEQKSKNIEEIMEGILSLIETLSKASSIFMKQRNAYATIVEIMLGEYLNILSMLNDKIAESALTGSIIEPLMLVEIARRNIVAEKIKFEDSKKNFGEVDHSFNTFLAQIEYFSKAARELQQKQEKTE